MEEISSAQGAEELRFCSSAIALPDFHTHGEWIEETSEGTVNTPLPPNFTPAPLALIQDQLETPTSGDSSSQTQQKPCRQRRPSPCSPSYPRNYARWYGLLPFPAGYCSTLCILSCLRPANLDRPFSNTASCRLTLRSQIPSGIIWADPAENSFFLTKYLTLSGFSIMCPSRHGQDCASL